MATEAHPRGVTAYSYDFPPGTETVDLSGKEEHVHYPMPDDNPHDPLNWSKKWKHLTFFTGIWYTFMSTTPLLAFNAIYPTMMAEFRVSPSQLSTSAGWAGFALAWGVLLVVPASSYLGRRPMLFYINLFTIATLVWYAKCGSFVSLVWARNIQGLSVAAIEILNLTQTGDLFFTSEAGMYHALGLAPLIIATSAGAPILGAMVDRGWSWRSFIWMFVGITTFTQILIFVALPETRWTRTADSARGIAKITILSQDTSADEEKRGGIDQVISVHPSDVLGLVGRGAPSKKQRWSLIPTLDRSYRPLHQLKTVFILLTFPPVLLANCWWLAVGGAAVGFGFLSSQIFFPPPYLFTSGQIFGGLLGLALVGPISDWDLARRTRNNGGVREAEMRLHLALWGGLLTIVSLVIYALAIEHKWHYLVILLPGSTFFATVSSFPVVSAINYSTDCYKKYPLEISTSMSVTKGLWTFGLGYFINSLTTERGAFVSIMLCAIPIFFATAVTAVFLFFGKPLRRLTMNSALLQ